MTIDKMRHIDKYVGIPLCFLMTLLLRIGKLFRKTKKEVPDLSRTLFIELSEMGSAILADPAMRYLREWGGGELYFAIFTSNAASLNLLDTVTTVNRFKMRSDSFLHLSVDVFRFWRWCRRNKITTVIDLELYSRFTALLCALSGAETRVGFYAHHDEGFYRGHIINYPVRYNAHVHISVNFMSLVHTALGYHTTPYPTTVVRKEDLQLAQANIETKYKDTVSAILTTLYPNWQEKRIILFNINASDMLPQRKWLLSNFVEVARNLLANIDDILILATGSESEKAYVQKFVEEVANDRCVNTAGSFTLNELVALYTFSDCMLTNDSGPAHFASVTSLKTFVLFGPETPDLYLPLGNAEAFYLGLPCSPCVSANNHRKTDCKTRECMKGIGAEEVISRLADEMMRK